MKRILAMACCVLLLAGCGAAPAPSASSAAATAAPSASAASPTPAPTAVTEPLTGLAPAEGASVTSRPVAVMVRSTDTASARQWGITSASVVIEALTEGKTTNRMFWFDSLAAVPKTGPVAQAKDVFWQLALPENSILTQKGMNLYAENLLNCYAWQPLDAQMLGVNCFDFDSSDPAAADADCWYTQGASLQNGLAVYGQPADGSVPQWQQFGTPAAGSPAAALTVTFSDVASATLKWENGVFALYRTDGTPQLDANSGAQAVFANAVVLYASAGVKDDKYTRDYDLTGGSGLYLTNGTWQRISWKKGDAAAPLQLLDASGAALTLTPGKTYLALYGGFAGQSVALTDAAGAAIDPGLAAPAPLVTATPAPTPDPAAATPDPAAATPDPNAAPVP